MSQPYQIPAALWAKVREIQALPRNPFPPATPSNRSLIIEAAAAFLITEEQLIHAGAIRPRRKTAPHGLKGAKHA